MPIETMFQMLLEGFLVSLQIFGFTLVGAVPLGVLVALLRMSRLAPVRLITRVYISVMRGTPAYAPDVCHLLRAVLRVWHPAHAGFKVVRHHRCLYRQLRCLLC